MRVMVFFDLPMESSENRRDYSRFRNHLLSEGFIMVQKSVYSKVVLNAPAANAVRKDVAKHLPPDGIIQLLTITEKQFQNIEYLLGESQKEIIDTLDRFVVL